MRRLAQSAAVVIVLLTAGCIGDQKAPSQPSLPTTVTVLPPVAATPPDMSAVTDLRQEVQVSSNATHNAISGLGVQVSKVAERVQGFGGDLLKVQTQVDAAVTAQAVVATELRADVRAEMQTVIASQVSANVALLRDLKTEITALAQTQVGLKNQIERTEQTVTAGRDNHVTQFTKEMLEAFKSENQTQLAAVKDANSTLYWTVIGMCAVIVKLTVILTELSRRRAEARYAELQKRVGETEGEQAHGKA